MTNQPPNRESASARIHERRDEASEADSSDVELCARIAHGDSGAFETMVERHRARAIRLAYSILGNEADANDVSQEAFIRLYQSAGTFDGRSKFSTWFHRVLVNLCIDHRRKGRWWQRLLPLALPGEEATAERVDPVSEAVGPEQTAMTSESNASLAKALTKLSPQQRAAVSMQAAEGYTSREIAEVLGCSENTARVHLHRGISQLRKLMKDS